MIRSFLFVLFIVIGSHLFSQSTNVKINVQGLADSTAIIGYHFGSQRLIYDTLDVVDGSIPLQSDKMLPKGLYFIYTPDFYAEFVLNEPSFEISFSKEQPYYNFDSKGSLENELFSDFQSRLGQLQKQQRALSEQVKTLSGDDSVRVMDELKIVSEQIQNYQDSLIKNNPETFIASFIKLMRGKQVPDFEEIEDSEERKKAKYNFLKNTYFDDLIVVEMMRTPVIHQYVMRYFNDLVLPRPDTIIKEIDQFMTRIEEDEPTFRYWLVTFFNKYQESKMMGMDAVTAHLVENYYLTDKVDWMSAESKEEMRKELQFIKPNLIGKKAPPLTLEDTLGNVVSLEDFEETYLVLYFYDPDCGICKKKTPILKKDYSSLQEENAEVLAVCSITDTSKWKEYVSENDLNWVNLADPSVKSNFRAYYNVRSTPQLYILDEERKIIAKKLDVNQVLDFIRDHKRIYSDD